MSSTQSKTKGKASLSFAAIDPYLENNIILPTEKNVVARNMVEWGDGNRYPDYLLELYGNVPTLRSIVNGNVDYIGGNDVTILPLQNMVEGIVNGRGDTIRDQVKDIARDYEIYGGFALQIIRNYLGEVSEIYYLDIRFLRCNKDCNVFYYCEDWHKNSRKDCIVYPAFMPNLDWTRLTDEEKNRHASSVLYVKNAHTQVYPAPVYAASVKACEIERNISDFHLSSLNNQFVSSAIINFNNGIPDDEMKEEIENSFGEKFTGSANGGRVMFSWNRNKESATDIQEFKIEDFGERYQSLSEYSRQMIFTAFRAIPCLFGIIDKTGFNEEEYQQSFKLYNRTQIKPVQRLIAETYEKIYGQKGVLQIVPFSLGGETEDKVM